jgi:hypothetical protein
MRRIGGCSPTNCISMNFTHTTNTGNQIPEATLSFINTVCPSILSFIASYCQLCLKTLETSARIPVLVSADQCRQQSGRATEQNTHVWSQPQATQLEESKPSILWRFPQALIDKPQGWAENRPPEHFPHGFITQSWAWEVLLQSFTYKLFVHNIH